jgi:hypothetical protein
MGSEKSVTNYKSTLRNITVERKYNLYRGGNFKSRINGTRLLRHIQENGHRRLHCCKNHKIRREMCLNKVYSKFRAQKYLRREENQLYATEWFIALIICSACFGHFCAHHQELEPIHVLLPLMVCGALFVGCWRSGAGQQAMRWGRGMLLDCRRTTSLIPNA